MEPDAARARENERLRRYYEQSAAAYDGWMRHYDPAMLGDGRARLCARASGRTLELAVGTGLNLPHYPRDVDLTGIDLTPAMLDHAGRRAHRPVTRTRSISPTPTSTPWWRRSCSPPSPTTDVPSPRRGAC